MALHIRDVETDHVVRELARRTGMTMTDAVRLAATEKLASLKPPTGREDIEPVDKRPFLERIRDIQERLAAYPKSGLKADKAFYDSLSDEE